MGDLKFISIPYWQSDAYTNTGKSQPIYIYEGQFVILKEKIKGEEKGSSLFLSKWEKDHVTVSASHACVSSIFLCFSSSFNRQKTTPRYSRSSKFPSSSCLSHGVYWYSISDGSLLGHIIFHNVHRFLFRAQSKCYSCLSGISETFQKLY